MYWSGRRPALALASILSSSAILALTANPALAQNVTSSITGAVNDASGAVVPNAKISLRNNSTGQQLTVQTNGGEPTTSPTFSPASIP